MSDLDQDFDVQDPNDPRGSEEYTRWSDEFDEETIRVQTAERNAREAAIIYADMIITAEMDGAASCGAAFERAHASEKWDPRYHYAQQLAAWRRYSAREPNATWLEKMSADQAREIESYHCTGYICEFARNQQIELPLRDAS